MLTVSTLMRKYGRFTAVKDASFSIQSGEIVGLLGHNGAGKTTILKMLSGYLEPHHGTIELDGIDVVTHPKIAQQQIGYLPENLPVYSEMSIADYLYYAAAIKGIPEKEHDQHIRRVIQATDIADKLLASIGTLSRGYKQRVGVAQALLGDPKFLILDEPTNGLDPTQTAQMRQLIRQASHHATIILSTHIMQEVEALCDRVLIIRGGELAMDAQLADLRQTHQLHLHCSLNDSEIQSLPQTLSDIQAIHPLPDSGDGHYQIELTPQAELTHACRDIAQTVVAHGDLYTLQPQQMNLETLFRQVNQQPLKEDTHAA
ncbi:ABC transporter ATP-binding protein [Celerinatantimonas sp. YJH-8]|uniref:ABC transporter ATP-binding protein n=1 Tax=Celerinatantimonas sp. YJH-8 TaxID=3228714 RepID=UPI0038C93849